MLNVTISLPSIYEVLYSTSIMKPATFRPFLPQPAIKQRTCISRVSRGYAVQAPGNPTLQVFNRNTKYLQKERAASNVIRSRQADYLKDEVAMRLSERLLVGQSSSIASMLIVPGYKSTFQPCPRPRGKLMQHSAGAYSSRS